MAHEDFDGLDHIDSGHMALPEFSGLCLEPRQVAALFDSLLSPASSRRLLVWATGSEDSGAPGLMGRSAAAS